VAEEVLIGISEACRFLGVSETALRQWTDEGKIKAFVTPGGHRRYLTTDLKKFMSSSSRAIGIKELAAELKETASLHRDIGLEVFHETPWSDRLTQESREILAELGRRLLSSLIKYITAPAEREITLNEVRDIGQSLGREVAQLGLSLTDAVEAFVKHRDPILKVATDLLKKREAYSGRVADSIPLVTRVLDEAMISLVAAYQQYRNESQVKPEKETLP